MTPLKERIAKARTIMAQQAIDGLLVLAAENRRYLSGFTAEDHQFDETAGYLFITRDQLFLITDSRFELQAKAETLDWEIIIYPKSSVLETAALCRRMQIRTLGVESQRISMHQFKELEAEIKNNHNTATLVPVADLGEALRVVKDQDEIALTYQALGIAETAFREVVKKIKPGINEKQIAWEMEKSLREAGADALSFPVIVASGPNSALPHAIPGERKVGRGEPILIDWGCKLKGYCSDTTRTLVIGPPDDTFQKVFRCVLEAQLRAIDVIRAGASTKAVDAAAREYIHAQGYQGKFGHGLGHGTGLAVHEAPRLSPIRESILEPGMIVTVEPGIYLPNWGGVRIEHQVVVRPDGAEIMNTLSTNYDIDSFL